MQVSEPNTIIPSHGKRRFDVWFSHLFVFVFFQKLEADFEQDFRCQPLHIPIHSIAFFLFGHFHSNSYHQKKSPPPKQTSFKFLYFTKKSNSSFCRSIHRIGDAISQDLQALEAIWLHYSTRRSTWSEYIEYDTLSQKPSSLGPEVTTKGNHRESLNRLWVVVGWWVLND